MLERVLVAIHSARPVLSVPARAVIEAVVLSKGSIGTAESVANALGLGNRFRLARLLKHDGLPPLHRMTEWVTVLNWIECAECQHVSLCWMAFRSHRHPSACYRLVKKVTGHGWEDVLDNGSAWVLRQFLNELRKRARSSGQHRVTTSLPPAAAAKDARHPNPPLRLS